MSKKLSVDAIKLLLKKKESKVTVLKNEHKRWPSDVNLAKLAEAVRNDRRFVVFGNGQRFNIKYRGNSVLIKPSTGEFCPMGYFDMKKLKESNNHES